MTLTDEERRALQQRKEELQERQRAKEAKERWAARLEKIAQFTNALDAAGATYDIVDMSDEQTWLPDWIPDGYSRIPWELAPRTENTFHEYDRIGSSEVIAEALSRIAACDDLILIIFEDPWLAVRLNRTAAASLIAAALEAARFQYGEVWIGDPSGSWIIRSDRQQTLVCLPVIKPAGALTAEREGRRLRREEIRDLLSLLAQNHVRYRVKYPDRGYRGDLLRPPRVDWRKIAKSLSIAQPDHPWQTASAVQRFLTDRGAMFRKVQVHTCGLRVDVDGAGFIRHLRAILALQPRHAGMLLTAEGYPWQLNLSGRWIYGVG